MFHRATIKIERWRVELWKHCCTTEAATNIVDPDDPINGMVREYSNGLNAGLKMAVKWYGRYVEGKE